jgi:hypothetical protein
MPFAATDGQTVSGTVTAGLEGYDPIGRLVDPGETYLPADSFYLDAGTANPFEALEQYGRALREATGAKPNVYDFPTVCAWYAGVWKTGGAQDHPDKSAYKINTSAGLVEEAQKIKASGFLNYSRAAVRLVPDNYTEYNPQGWWDDKHWQHHGLYTAPYETSEKLGKGMHENGCCWPIPSGTSSPKSFTTSNVPFHTRPNRAAPGPWMLSLTPAGRESMTLPSRPTGIRSRSSTTPCRLAKKPSLSRLPVTLPTAHSASIPSRSMTCTTSGMTGTSASSKARTR